MKDFLWKHARVLLLLCVAPVVALECSAEPTLAGHILMHGQIRFDDEVFHPETWMGLWKIDAQSGNPVPFLQDTQTTAYRSPRYLPDGTLRAVAIAGQYTGEASYQLVSVQPVTRTVSPLRVVTGAISYGIWNRRRTAVAYPVKGGYRKLDLTDGHDSLLLVYGNLYPRRGPMSLKGADGDWTPDEKIFVAPMDDGQIYSFHTDTGVAVPLVPGVAAKVAPSGKYTAVIIGENHTLGTRDQPKRVALLDENNKQQLLYSVSGANDYVNSILWSPDSTCLAILEEHGGKAKGGSVYFLKILNTASKEVILEKSLGLSNVGPLEDWVK